MMTFKTIYVVEPSHDFSALKPYCKRIAFLTTGYETPDELESTIRQNLKGFNHLSDAILPVGRVISCLVTGYVLMDKVPYWIGTYSKQAESPYRFTHIGE